MCFCISKIRYRESPKLKASHTEGKSRNIHYITVGKYLTEHFLETTIIIGSRVAFGAM
jgi:hypothetical protein